MGVATIVTNVHRRSYRVLGVGFLTLKNDVVHDSVKLEDKGDPTANHADICVLDSNNNQNSCETKVKGYP